MLRPYVNFLATSALVIGGAWAMYCITPAGAAEREQTRQQKDLTRHVPNKSAQKRNTD